MEVKKKNAVLKKKKKNTTHIHVQWREGRGTP